MVKTKEKKLEEKETALLNSLTSGKIEFRDIDEILQRTVYKFGNSGRVNIPAKHIGKDVQVTIWNDDIEQVGFDKDGNKVYRQRLDNKKLKEEKGNS